MTFIAHILIQAMSLKIKHEKGQEPNDIIVYAYDGSRVVAKAIFGMYPFKRYKGHPYCFSVKVDEDYRRKGVATQMYLYAEKHYGKKLAPSANQSEDSKALWNDPNRKFGIKLESAAAKASKKPTGFNLNLIPDQDVQDAYEFACDDFLEGHDREADWKMKKDKIKLWEPEDLVDMGAFTRQPKGWLLKEPKEEWPKLLKEEFSRDLSHILQKKEKGELPPAITINDQFADGRGRAMVQYSLNEKIPAMNFNIKEEVE